jgi:hypothetical protein
MNDVSLIGRPARDPERGTERPQAGRAATGGDGENHSRDEASAGEPDAEAAPAAATGIDSVPLGDGPDQARGEPARVGDDLEEFR